MTTEAFDRATYGAMSVADLAAAFERIVGRPPEKRNKLWMLTRMDQAASARAAAARAVAGAQETGETRAEGESQEATPPASAASRRAEEEVTAEPAVAVEAAEWPTADAAAAAPEAQQAEPPAPTGAPSTAGVVTIAGDAATSGAVAANDGADDEASDAAEGGGAGARGKADGEMARRRYIPARFRAMSIPDLHALYLATVGRPTKSVDVPYLAWKIKQSERRGTGVASVPRRSRRGADGASRGEAKAVTLREYPDTLAAVEGVCSRHHFRNRLDFFRRAAHAYLEQLGEPEAAAFFAETAPPDTAPSPAAPRPAPAVAAPAAP